jgi:hypothetical protein
MGTNNKTLIRPDRRVGSLAAMVAPTQTFPESAVSLLADGHERGDVRVLDAKTWHERRERLEKLGGPPRTD